MSELVDPPGLEPVEASGHPPWPPRAGGSSSLCRPDQDPPPGGSCVSRPRAPAYSGASETESGTAAERALNAARAGKEIT